MYGLTEAFRSTYLDPALIDTHPTSMGKAIPHAEILVVNDEGAIAADNEEGELVHTGPLVAQGYWRDAQRTAERYRPAPEGSVYGGMAVWSGDRVRRDADGLLYFVGRRDAMIKSSGNRISPQELEDAALATGLVAEVVALGLPDVRLGQAVHLVVRAAPAPKRPKRCSQTPCRRSAQFYATQSDSLERHHAHRPQRQARPHRPLRGDPRRSGGTSMKPLGPIPAGFAARDGVLAVDGIKITELIAQAGATPAFVYSSGLIRARVAALRAAMPEAWRCIMR
jgi:acyl-CoA synthetase (AMP-forming)/AMP-acid ligase II